MAACYNDSVRWRFAAEGGQEPFVAYVKQCTSNPVVGVGRFTAPDTVGWSIRRGVLDLIGAAPVHRRPVPAEPGKPTSRVAVLDDDGVYYTSLAGEHLRAHGGEVVYVMQEDTVAPWSQNTSDYRHIRERLAMLGVEVIVSHTVAGCDGDTLTLHHAWESRQHTLTVDTFLTVTARLPDDALYQQLPEREADWADARIHSVRNIGDSDAAGLIAHAVYTWHRHVRELGEPVTGEVAFKRHFHVTSE